MRIAPWRPLFAIAGVLIFAGGFAHPRGGGMAAMLADPAWSVSHLVILLGFVALLAGLALFRRGGPLPPATDRWSRWALMGTILQVVEMAFHAAANVDLDAYLAGGSTPVYWIHITLTIVFVPIFAFLMAGLILAGARERALGSPWIAWLGIAGAAAHGLAPILVLVLRLGGFGFLFPMVLLLAVWLALAAFVPVRAPAGA